MKHKSFLISLLLLLALGLSMPSCVKQPYACFEPEVDEDSIFVNIPVSFNGFCSSNTNDFYWSINDNDDSVFFTPIITTVFHDTGIVKISLIVSNGNKINSQTKEFIVH